jgi:hypothetical protein
MLRSRHFLDDFNYATLEDNLKALKSALAKSNDRAHLLLLQTRQGDDGQYGKLWLSINAESRARVPHHGGRAARGGHRDPRCCSAPSRSGDPARFDACIAGLRWAGP